MVKFRAKAGRPNQLVWHEKRNSIIAHFVNGFCEVDEDIAIILKKLGYSEVKVDKAETAEVAEEPATKPKRGTLGK